jgi:hypothetical protein
LDLRNFQHLLRHIKRRGDKGNKVLQILAGIALGWGKRRGLGCSRLAEKQNRRKEGENRKPPAAFDTVNDVRNSSHNTILWAARNIVESQAALTRHAVILSMDSPRPLSVMSGRRREINAIEPLNAKDLRGDVLESATARSEESRSGLFRRETAGRDASLRSA